MENIVDTYSLISRTFQEYSESVALEAPGHNPLSFSGLLRHIHYIHTCLRTMGIERSDRVAIVLPGGIELAIVLAGVSASSVCAPLNPGFQLKEFSSCFDKLKIKVLIVASGQESQARQVASERGIPILELTPCTSDPSGMVFSFEGHPVQKADTNDVQISIQPEDVAIVLHTSGTTSQPKVVPLTHLNICTATRYVCDALKLNPRDRCLCMMPQFHIGGFVDLLLAPLARGGSIICAPGISPEKFFELLERYQPTWYQAVPATLSLILEHVRALGIKRVESSLRFIRSVAAPLPPQMMRDLEALFNVPVIETFGMTEAAPLITTNPLPPEVRKPGSTGKTVGPDIAIMDDYGNILPQGETGEIVINGENVMTGYESDALANEHAFAHGWFHTGDIGHLDEDGYLYITGRLKEIINRGGEKLSPNEIDHVLLENPAIAQAMTFAVPDVGLGESVAAAIVLIKGQSPDENDIRTFVAERLSFEKVPQRIVFVDDIPKGPTGKPLRTNAFEKFMPMMHDHLRSTTVPPRTPTEKRLHEIWKENLNTTEIGIQEDFFSLGGDSLQIENLMTTLEKRFGTPFSTSFVYRYPTIEAQAKIIESGQDESMAPFSYAESNAEQKTCFWILPQFPYQDLSLIPLETLYETEIHGKIDKVKVESLAKKYVSKMQNHSPNGPYFLGGFSIGGLIAIEAAKQLEALGKDVIHLFLVDPYIERNWEKGTTLKEKLRFFLKNFNNLSLRENCRQINRIRLFAFRLLRCNYYFRAKLPLPPKLRNSYVSYIYSSAAHAYEPPAFAGKTTIYFRKSHPSLEGEAWRHYCPNAEVLLLDTNDHLETMRQPYSRFWLTDLRKQLQ